MNFIFDKNGIKKALNGIKIKTDFIFNLAIAKKMTTDYVFNTASLEGNLMTYPEVQTLLEGITIGGHKLSDEKQILNQNSSWKLLLDLVKNKTFELNKNIICNLHKEVAKEEALIWGEFRNGEVKIGGTDYIPPKKNNLENLFKKGFEEIKKEENILLKSFLSFLFLANSQFFFDGNKRTGRLVMNGILLQNGLPFLNILAKNKLEFNEKMIEFFDTQNATNILKFLIIYYKKQLI